MPGVDVFSNFGNLDELIQVIYQGPSRLFVLSNVLDDAWTIHLGLNGPGGRWWRGKWTEKDVLGIVGSRVSDAELETFCDKIVKSIVNGELSVDDWSSNRGTPIKLNFGPTSKAPLRMPLSELSPEEAASQAASILFNIGLQAQSRKCRLEPPVFSSARVASPPPPAVKRAPREQAQQKAAKAKAPAAIARDPPSKNTAEQDEIKRLKSELAKAQQQTKLGTIADVEAAGASTGAKRPPKGASLANPNKKARKYQAIEFESDEE